MEDPTIAGALLGAAITAAAAVVIFVLERIVSSVSSYRTQRRIAFEDVIEAFTEYAQIAIGLSKQPDHTAGGRLLSSHARLLLAMGKSQRKIAWWVSGMQRMMGGAARSNPDKKARVNEIENVLSRLINALVDLHTGRLMSEDFDRPSRVFWAEANGIDVTDEDLITAMRPLPMGRTRAYRRRVVMGVLMVGLRVGAWLGFRESLDDRFDRVAP